MDEEEKRLVIKAVNTNLRVAAASERTARAAEGVLLNNETMLQEIRLLVQDLQRNEFEQSGNIKKLFLKNDNEHPIVQLLKFFRTLPKSTQFFVWVSAIGLLASGWIKQLVERIW